MKHLGDITQLKGNKIPKVDIITGGSPCQDLSVAGKREGLAGERSGLFMEQIRLIKEMRESDRADGRTDDYIRPRYMVWENVPGAFSSNKGEDFRCVLEETAKIADSNATIPRLKEDRNGKQKWSKSGAIMGDGWSIAWRVHDAQFWGVPQRRKRISLVADFGGETAPEILFERKGLSGDITESGKERQGAAADVERGVGETGGAISFQERAGKEGGGKGILIQNERTGALSTLNNQPVCYGISSYDSNAMKSSNPHSGIYEAETTRTLDNNGGNPACNQGGIAVVQASGVVSKGNGECFLTEEKHMSLSVGGGQAGQGYPCVCIEGNGSRPSHKGDGYAESETMYTLNSTEHHAVAYRKTSHAKSADDGQGWAETDVNDTLNAFDSGETRTPTVVLENHPNDSRVKIREDGTVQTLSSRMGTGGGNVPMVMEPMAIGNGQVAQTRLQEKVGALNCMYDQQAVISFGNGQVHDAMSPSVDVAKTLNCMDDPAKIVTYGFDRASFNQGANAKYNFSIEEEKIGAQVARGPGAVCTNYKADGADGNGVAFATVGDHDGRPTDMTNLIQNESIVRRLTPLECERLQGFPDGWTDIGEWYDSKGKKHKDADSPRYKALGNSIALPFWEWMAKRMVKHINHEATMGSLFDGIGGFSLVFSRAGVKPIWASEIEEFPIAVTKLRFKEEETHDM